MLDISEFPIEILLSEEYQSIPPKQFTMLCHTPEDVPQGQMFKVLRTKVILPQGKIINTGIPNVASVGAAD